MMTYGDECRRTQQGNNNAYCQDNEISWFDWSLVETNAHLVRFCRSLIAFRRRQPTVRRKNFLSGQPTGARPELPDVNWFTPGGHTVDWNGPDRSLICLLTAPGLAEDPEGVGRDVLLLLNASPEQVPFTLPAVARGIHWRLLVDTAADHPGDIFPDADGPQLPPSGRLTLLNHSLRCYVAHEEPTLKRRDFSRREK
jgi:glycogen operon protein